MTRYDECQWILDQHAASLNSTFTAAKLRFEHLAEQVMIDEAKLQDRIKGLQADIKELAAEKQKYVDQIIDNETKLKDELREKVKEDMVVVVRQAVVDRISDKLSKKIQTNTYHSVEKWLKRAVDAVYDDYCRLDEIKRGDLEEIGRFYEKKEALSKESRELRQQIKRDKERADIHSADVKALAARFDMPDVPTERYYREQLTEWDPFSGVYVAYEGKECRYVGESRNIPARMKSHEKVQHSWGVSVIPFPKSERFYAECFYIWLLRPTENREGMKTAAERVNFGLDDMQEVAEMYKAELQEAHDMLSDMTAVPETNV